MYTLNELAEMYKKLTEILHNLENHMADDRYSEVYDTHSRLWNKVTAKLFAIDEYAKAVYGKTIYVGSRGGINIKNI